MRLYYEIVDITKCLPVIVEFTGAFVMQPETLEFPILSNEITKEEVFFLKTYS